MTLEEEFVTFLESFDPSIKRIKIKRSALNKWMFKNIERRKRDLMIARIIPKHDIFSELEMGKTLFDPINNRYISLEGL